MGKDLNGQPGRPGKVRRKERPNTSGHTQLISQCLTNSGHPHPAKKKSNSNNNSKSVVYLNIFATIPAVSYGLYI